MKEELGVGIIGYGVMGRTHAEAYAAAGREGIPNRMRAVFTQADMIRAAVGNLDAMVADVAELADVRVTGEVDELLSDASIDVVSICTPTDTHIDLALRALAAGKHVFVEKPVALTVSEIVRLDAAAVEAGLVCLPAMCMRFWPGWPWLHNQIRSGDLGEVRSASFVRMGNPPDWGGGFYGDTARSGGALHDLHVHDVDFVQWCFGTPESVTSSGGALHITTMYHFPDGPAPVTAEGGWTGAQGFPFRMRYSVEFDETFVEFELGADPEVRVIQAGGIKALELPASSAYHEEVRHFLRVVRAEEAPRVTLADAATTARILAAEAGSAAAGGVRMPVEDGDG